MKRLVHAYTTLSELAKNPDHPWYKRFTGVTLLGAVAVLVLLVWTVRKWYIGKLEAEADAAERRAHRIEKVKETESDSERAEYLHHKAREERKKAYQAREKADDTIMDFLEDDTRIEAAKSWDSLQEMYNEMD